METALLAFFYVVRAAPFGFAVYFFIKFWRHRDFMKTARISTGEVIRLADVETRYYTMKALWLRYHVEGQVYEAKPDLLLRSDKVQLGQTFELRYLPENPVRIALTPNGKDTQGLLYLLYTIAMIVAGILVLVIQNRALMA